MISPPRSASWHSAPRSYVRAFKSYSAWTLTRRRVLDGLKRTRPVVETGFENTLLARCVYEEIPGYSVDEILASWGALMPPLMERWNLGAFYTNVFTCISPIARFQQLTAFPFN